MSYDNNNIFAKILRGEIPCKKIYEDDFVLSFHDIKPQKKIHALVIPKGKYVDLDDFSTNASSEEMVGLLKGINIVAKKLGISTEVGKGYRALYPFPTSVEIPSFFATIFIPLSNPTISSDEAFVLKSSRSTYFPLGITRA